MNVKYTNIHNQYPLRCANKMLGLSYSLVIPTIKVIGGRICA